MNDHLPKPYWTDAKAQGVVALWRASGLSLSAYCRANGIHKRRLSYWIRKEPRSAVSDVGFVELRATPISTALELHVRQGMRIPITAGFDPHLLRAVVEALS
jgi:hypothetical protein